MTAVSLDVRGKTLQCPECGSQHTNRCGHRSDNTDIQRWICKGCGYRFSEKPLQKTSEQPLNTSNALLLNAKYALNGATKNLTLQAIVDKAIAGEKTTLDARLIEYAWKEKKRQIANSTIAHRVFRLNVLKNRGVNLDDPDSFLTVLMTEDFSAASKFHYVQAYQSYAKAFKIPFDKPKIQYEPKEQYTPKPYEVTTLVQNLGREQAALCQTLADTGARIGEIARLLESEIDLQGQIIYINHPEKGSRARKIHVSEQTIAMLRALPKKYGPNVFNPNKRTLQSTYARSRNRIAKKLQMPSLLRIHHHSFRRYFADQTYKKTRFNTRKVQARLGHKRLSSTEKYFGDFDDENCTYETARAYTIEEQEELRKLGYELYDTGIDKDGRTVKLYSRLT
jgi:integrase/ribosomal protein L37AE/L43A